MTLRQRKTSTVPIESQFLSSDEGTSKKDGDAGLSSCKQAGGDETHFQLLQRRSAHFRLDVAPFVLLYSICIAMDALEGSAFATPLFAAGLLLHLAVVVGSAWSNHWRATIGYVASQNRSGSTHCFVQEGFSGPTGIVEVEHTDSAIQLRFQDKLFRCSTSSDCLDHSLWGQPSPATPAGPSFQSLFYPDALPLSFFAEWKGHSNPKSAMTAEKVYGRNSTALQLPTLTDLLIQQLSAPFFLFQVVCCALWSLDEYWYYALMTLLMLVLFENVQAYNRLQSLQRLHEVAAQHMHQRAEVKRYPGAQWIRIPIAELVPGDWIRLGGAGAHVPADIVLMEGSTVVDEALLTGESVPQLKQPLDVGESDEQRREVLNISSPEYKDSVLFGGTVLVTTNTDGSAQGIVVRTGFATAQGSLLRTMAHGNHSISADHQRDTGVFIATLFLFGIVAGAYVILSTWEDDRRNRFRLMLHVILLITSTVPPELPLELSLAVTHAVQALQKRCSVFCTEPNRIPVAGQVTVCCKCNQGAITDS